MINKWRISEIISSMLSATFMLILLMLVVSSCINSINPKDSITYAETDSIVPNPERGYAMQFDPPWPKKVTWDHCEQDESKYTWTAWNEPMTIEMLTPYFNKGWRLVNARYHLAEFRHKPISSTYLERMQEDFNSLREVGMKVILRFAYNYPMGGPDAPIDQVMVHLNQLEDILQKNIDVITYMELGFIGCWGEGHSSSYNLQDTEKGYNRINENSIRIIDRLFEIIPEYRMIAVRYPEYKFQYFNGLQDDPKKENKHIIPMSVETAFDGSMKSRWGIHDDCPVCGEYHAGTLWNARENPNEVRDFLNMDNRFVVQGGEPGGEINGSEKDLDGDGYTTGEYDMCERVLKIFEEMRWSTLNAEWGTRSYDRWKNEGCYEEIQKKLGYRFVLKKASFEKKIKGSKNFKATLQLSNQGWAAPYNPRRVELILRNTETGDESIMVICKGKYKPDNREVDPRFWLPEKNITLDIDHPLPDGLKKGEYNLFLNFPDPLLPDRPEYSIRLANDSLWEEKTGYNSLRYTIKLLK